MTETVECCTRCARLMAEKQGLNAGFLDGAEAGDNPYLHGERKELAECWEAGRAVGAQFKGYWRVAEKQE